MSFHGRAWAMAVDFEDASVQVARALVGALLLVDGVGGLIVETEAYDAEDLASHSYTGPGERNASMFGPAGHAYIYRSHGIHWCLNIDFRGVGHGAAVAIRAMKPACGLDLMRQRRRTENDRVFWSAARQFADGSGTV